MQKLLYICGFICTLLIILFPVRTYAQSVFYEDENIRITWPDTINASPCPDNISNKYTNCRQFGDPDTIGIAFVTIHENFKLGTPELLQNHLDASEHELARVSSIQVMQSKIISDTPLVAMMNVLRKDSIFADIKSLSTPPLNQVSFIIPAGNQLIQIFIYLPLDDPRMEPVFTSLFDYYSKNITVKTPPSIPETQQVSQDPPQGALSLMPKALIYGGIFAILFIALLIFRSYLSRKNKDREIQKQNESLDRTDISIEDES